jgi:hypothetical protein
MKSLIAAVVVVLGLAAVNGSEAQAGHGGHAGHAGYHAGHPYSVHYHRGFYRKTWAVRTWNATYNRYIYADPGVQGTFYYSEVEKLYFPIDRLVVPSIGAITVQPR